MKVFISHKDADSLQALLLKRAFENEGVSAYLDVLDSSINGGGKTLTEHIKGQLNQCTDIIVLMSEATKYSWWVPFEIGMSAQIDMPTASYLKENVVLPSYLSYWPRLKTINDVSTYVSVRKKTERTLNEQYSNFELSSVSNRRKIETPIFYENLKRELR
ncbi:MAG: toll/interleukin-1 receptor domain-containing protein [Oscillospiraceae bacterium]|nr:toll/interleukin-1 receptor domain-containing protein [Oscillospiraceae bacterium]